MSFYRKVGKRALDLAVTVPAAILLSPLLLILGALIAFKLGRPVLFRQERTGWKRRPFHILKFRSMLDKRDAEGRLLADEERMTPFGRFLRAWSLDELPSIWNILRGEMSIIGPRPFIHEYDKLYSPDQARRFQVPPGVSGWAQVNGRNAISWEEKFAYDNWYVDHQSFALDLRILAATVMRVFTRHGINNEQAATMPLFQGKTAAPDEAPADHG